jgi:hypothetical protein
MCRATLSRLNWKLGETTSDDRVSRMYGKERKSCKNSVGKPERERATEGLNVDCRITLI